MVGDSTGDGGITEGWAKAHIPHTYIQYTTIPHASPICHTLLQRTTQWERVLFWNGHLIRFRNILPKIFKKNEKKESLPVIFPRIFTIVREEGRSMDRPSKHTQRGRESIRRGTDAHFES